jgi:hypothetical protein
LNNTHPALTGLYQFIHSNSHVFDQLTIRCAEFLKKHDRIEPKYRNFFALLDELNKLDESMKYSSDFSEKLLDKIISANEEDDGKTSNCALYHSQISEYWKIISKHGRYAQYRYFDRILLFIVILKGVFGELSDFSNMSDMIDLTLPFYFIYTPPNIIKRVENQSSLFIHQLHYDDDLKDIYIESATNNKRVVQNIVPDYKFVINNQVSILNELDLLGVNTKYVFNDYDSIARYIRSKDEHL